MRPSLIWDCSRTHTGVKPFKCQHNTEICTVAFTTKQCLQVRKTTSWYSRLLYLDNEVLDDGETEIVTDLMASGPRFPLRIPPTTDTFLLKTLQ